MRPSLVLLLMLLLAAPSFGKSLASIEQDLLQDLKRIHYWADYENAPDHLSLPDSVERANERFRRKLLHYAATEPATLTAEFRLLRAEHLTIATAPDQQLRIYSWDTRTGGTMHFFANVYQFRRGPATVGARCLPLPAGHTEPGGFYSELFAVRKGAQTYYLGLAHGIHSSRDCYQQVKVFTIEAGQLNPDARLIRTASGLKNTLGFAYDFFSVADRPERPVRLITYDAATRRLQLPVVWAGGKVTTGRISYQFTSTEFVKLNP
ncbi:hypothetical protein EJV47_20990 [Hymenobacter gummosus]|uniref:DUF1571 domain-containing protein n=1 Tax=Hymenobacter gummosus TaxID=1776032 RepID=A0A431TXY8_9BACT|nr:hypothetical protein [Hymenobacter gummosus]RTQ46849.1 hypothetical protein EJV47_20990 [Hymenobacter gummosus]